MNIISSLFLATKPCEDAKCPYKNGGMCPKFWLRVFKNFYDDNPRNNGDLRWNTLFKEGFEARRTLRK